MQTNKGLGQFIKSNLSQINWHILHFLNWISLPILPIIFPHELKERSFYMLLLPSSSIGFHNLFSWLTNPEGQNILPKSRHPPYQNTNYVIVAILLKTTPLFIIRNMIFKRPCLPLRKKMEKHFWTKLLNYCALIPLHAPYN